jgi:alpha/beta hydrolase family protein
MSISTSTDPTAPGVGDPPARPPRRGGRRPGPWVTRLVLPLVSVVVFLVVWQVAAATSAATPGGSSSPGAAGGNLAAALALLARDRREVDVLGQLLMYPMLDDRNDTASVRQMTGIGVWDAVSNATGWAAWLGGRSGEDVPPYAAPAREPDLSGLPPTFLDAGSAESFRDEIVEYARRLWAAGGDAELHVWPGAYHAFDFLAPQAEISQRARAARLHWLRRLLGE